MCLILGGMLDIAVMFYLPFQRKEAETAQRGPREPDERAFGQGDVQPLSY